MKLFKKIVGLKFVGDISAGAQRQKHFDRSHFKADVIRRGTQIRQPDRASISARTAVYSGYYHLYTEGFTVRKEIFEIGFLPLRTDGAAMIELNHDRFGLYLVKPVIIEVQQRMSLYYDKVGTQLLRNTGLTRTTQL